MFTCLPAVNHQSLSLTKHTHTHTHTHTHINAILLAVRPVSDLRRWYWTQIWFLLELKWVSQTLFFGVGRGDSYGTKHKDPEKDLSTAYRKQIWFSTAACTNSFMDVYTKAEFACQHRTWSTLHTHTCIAVWTRVLVVEETYILWMQPWQTHQDLDCLALTYTQINQSGTECIQRNNTTMFLPIPAIILFLFNPTHNHAPDVVWICYVTDPSLPLSPHDCGCQAMVPL